jgi:hypothetical protein
MTRTVYVAHLCLCTRSGRDRAGVHLCGLPAQHFARGSPARHACRVSTAWVWSTPQLTRAALLLSLSGALVLPSVCRCNAAAHSSRGAGAQVAEVPVQVLQHSRPNSSHSNPASPLSLQQVLEMGLPARRHAAHEQELVGSPAQSSSAALSWQLKISNAARQFVSVLE